MTSLAQDLQEMRRLKDTAEELGREKKQADAEFKAKQHRCLQRMESEQCDSFRTNGYLYSAASDKLKGRVEDRREYVRWCLENDEAIDEFLGKWGGSDQAFYDDFFDAITSTSLVQYKESQLILNQQARSHMDDGVPLPPGMTFDPDPAIQMRKS